MIRNKKAGDTIIVHEGSEMLIYALHPCRGYPPDNAVLYGAPLNVEASVADALFDQFMDAMEVGE